MKHLITKNKYGSVKEITEYFFGLEYSKVNDLSGINNYESGIIAIKQFSKDRKELEVEYFSEGKPDYKTIYKYNEHNQLIETLNVNQSNNPIGKVIFRYDENGLKTLSLSYSDMNNIDLKVIRLYNNELKKISESLIHYNGGKNISFYYEYGNNVRERTCVIKDDQVSILGKDFSVFDHEGYIILSREFDSYNNLVSETEYSYNQHKNLLKTDIKSYTGSGIEKIQNWYEYVYDNMNNWIKCVHYAAHEELSSVVFRKIVYF